MTANALNDAHAEKEPTGWLCPLEHSPPLGKKIQLLTYTGIATYGKWSWEDGFIAWAPCLKIPERFKDRIGHLPKWPILRQNEHQAATAAPV